MYISNYLLFFLCVCMCWKGCLCVINIYRSFTTLHHHWRWNETTKWKTTKQQQQQSTIFFFILFFSFSTSPHNLWDIRVFSFSFLIFCCFVFGDEMKSKIGHQLTIVINRNQKWRKKKKKWKTIFDEKIHFCKITISNECDWCEMDTGHTHTHTHIKLRCLSHYSDC